jgi:hypothetical protein
MPRPTSFEVIPYRDASYKFVCNLIGLSPNQPFMEDRIRLLYECRSTAGKNIYKNEITLKLNHNQSLDIVDELKKYLV